MVGFFQKRLRQLKCGYNDRSTGDLTLTVILCNLALSYLHMLWKRENYFVSLKLHVIWMNRSQYQSNLSHQVGKVCKLFLFFIRKRRENAFFFHANCNAELGQFTYKQINIWTCSFWHNLLRVAVNKFKHFLLLHIFLLTPTSEEQKFTEKTKKLQSSCPKCLLRIAYNLTK